MSMQSIFNIAEICARKDVHDFILSPGSRCAPLTISLVRHPEIHTRTIGDERSAAFIALGMAQQTGKAVGLVCTSGSAAYNYAPAIAEAYYQQIPLLILTADRPPEWIDQLDGQTIRQNNIYGSHVKTSYTLPADLSHPDVRWHVERTLSEAINLSMEHPQGPVHINIPLREPFYPEKEITFDKNVKVIAHMSGERSLSPSQQKELSEEYRSYSRILIAGGQHGPDQELMDSLSSLNRKQHIPVVGDIISNLTAEGFIHHHDAILAAGQEQLQPLKPELLITFGKSFISKSLKTFFRKNAPVAHWHIQPAGQVADTFQSLTRVIHASPALVFNFLHNQPHAASIGYLQYWNKANAMAKAKTLEYFHTDQTFSEFAAMYAVFKALPAGSLLHLANSMPVRYANYITLEAAAKDIQVFGNRGTSGIDGTISTAYGAALSTGKTVTVLTGDMAFLYDRNAWWNNYNPHNLRVIILNNHGGGIFRIIDGPSRQPELEEYFETIQPLRAEYTASDYHLGYHFCNTASDLQKALIDFFEKSERAKILEIETDSRTNTEAFKRYKRLLL